MQRLDYSSIYFSPMVDIGKEMDAKALEVALREIDNDRRGVNTVPLSDQDYEIIKALPEKVVKNGWWNWANIAEEDKSLLRKMDLYNYALEKAEEEMHLLRVPWLDTVLTTRADTFLSEGVPFENDDRHETVALIRYERRFAEESLYGHRSPVVCDISGKAIVSRNFLVRCVLGKRLAEMDDWFRQKNGNRIVLRYEGGYVFFELVKVPKNRDLKIRYRYLGDEEEIVMVQDADEYDKFLRKFQGLAMLGNIKEAVIELLTAFGAYGITDDAISKICENGQHLHLDTISEILLTTKDNAKMRTFLKQYFAEHRSSDEQVILAVAKLNSVLDLFLKIPDDEPLHDQLVRVILMSPGKVRACDEYLTFSRAVPHKTSGGNYTLKDPVKHINLETHYWKNKSDVLRLKERNVKKCLVKLGIS